ncbi:hypothetical protein ACH4NI_35540 [Streptomyces olivaceus]|uniref:hypothetical protein n=1 Tax=Streptomyces olivaceus TaxID=47716 RepID=UPI0037B7BFA8
MALMTHTHTLPTTRDYRDLTPTQQDAFDWQITLADNAGPNDYFNAMATAAHIAGIHPTPSIDIAICDCLWHGCGCGLIFDSTIEGVAVIDGCSPGHNLSRLVCPTCAHDACHPAL